MGGWGNTPVARSEGAPCPYHNKTCKSLAVVEYLRTAMQRRKSTRSAYPALVVGPGVVTGD
ncbi:MAG: hypothetical protein ABIG63_02175, partial [Chloroflexota bacterium]